MNNTDAFSQALSRIGGISTLESAASRRLLDRMSAETEARESAVAHLTDLFKKAVAGDLAEPCAYGPSWISEHKRRMPNVGDMLADALDARNFMERAVKVLADCAAGRGSQRTAQLLLDEVAAHWADNRADEFVG